MNDPEYRNFSHGLRTRVAPVLARTLDAEQRRATVALFVVMLGVPTLVVLWVLSAVGS